MERRGGQTSGLSEVTVSVERIKVCEMPCSEDDDSQTGFLSEPGQPMSKAELRKVNSRFVNLILKLGVGISLKL